MTPPRHPASDHNKVLIVEDDPIVSLELSFTLREMGCLVIGIARNYPDAIRMMEECPADIVLCDINLHAVQNGIDVVHALIGKFRPAVIYLTASEDIWTVHSAIETRPCGYLVKPYRRAELLALVNIAMQKVRLQEDEPSGSMLDLGDGYRLSLDNGILTREGGCIELTKKETALLTLLASQKHRLVSFEAVAYHIWPEKPVPEGNRRTLIYRLHRKLGSKIITVLHGQGCFLRCYPPRFS